jgi:predicted amidophosphoribosyltransferase
MSLPKSHFHYNEGYASDILPLSPQGTNSTMFTQCCSTAICDHERNCPRCGRPVVGHDASSDHERSKARWRNATRHWQRKSA